ncbi:HEPN domain-containing protein [Treponema sp. OMZ 305]|uniref:HEPN domain-containing protein n=1 Tax=Treponema sp. OMZ 305 TaxID=1659192 RepID=UPI0020A49A88|nr:HEPN domain-containing protein [Treponema sp. OMZ 305]UTC56828.1 HEPN domain-containing protein [Treponema sp. OMZ 305]
MKDDIQRDVAEWLHFVKMDQNTACHLFESMHPQPLEIICFHCQQAAEKAIKALFILKEIEVIKIHDLAILLHKIESFFSVPVAVKNAGDDLTPFAATFRYPQSPDIDEALTRKALADMETVITWCKEQIVLAGYEIE